jgi:hypothetical protein
MTIRGDVVKFSRVQVVRQNSCHLISPPFTTGTTLRT